MKHLERMNPMRSISRWTAALVFCSVSLCLAQEWELGGAAGYGFYRNLTVTQGSQTGKAGFDKGAAVSAVVTQHPFNHFSGEFRYTYRQNDLIVESGSTKATMKGDAHLVHYDALINVTPKESRLRPYGAFFCGVKYYRGLGYETATQPLVNLAALTRTNEVLPLLSVGGGLGFRFADHAVLRFDFRDYITPFPSQVIAPVPGARLDGWMHDFVILIGVNAHF